MSQDSLQLVLAGGEPSFGGMVFRPWSKLTGHVSLMPNQEVKCRRIYVLLRWRTEGRGTPFTQNITEITIHEGDLLSLVPQHFPFTLDIPEGPWSYNGHYIKIVWEVIANVDIPWGRDWVQTAPIIVEPERGEDW